jgi:hypothetical protein
MTPEEIQRLLATSKLPPEELQRLQGVFGQPANASSSAYGQNVIGQSSTNVQRQNIAQLGDNLQDIKERGGQMLSGVKEEALKPGGMFKNAGGEYRGAMGGKSSAALGGIGTLLSGDPLGALVSTPVGIGAGAIANRAITAATQPLMAMGPYGKAAGMGLRFAAPALVGSGVQQAVAGMVGGVKAKAGESAASPGGADVSVGGIPLTEAARSRMQQERDIEMERKRMQTLGGAQLGLDREVLAMNTQDYIARQKAILPLQEQINRSNLINAQAKLASEGSMYQALGRQAGQYKLAGIDRTETGATLRTAISQNPYMGATLSAPSISFG